MYKLTLTRSERKAIDWVGYRYAHGDDLYKLLWGRSIANDGAEVEWDDDIDISFAIPEHIAWEIREACEEDNLECFSSELVSKLVDFCNKIV